MENKNDEVVDQRSKHNKLPDRMVGVAGSVLCSLSHAGDGDKRLGAESDSDEAVVRNRNSSPDHDGL